MNRTPRILLTLCMAAAGLPALAQHYRVDPGRRAPRPNRDGWVEVAELTARRGDPKEVGVGYEISGVRIQAVAETVIINTIVTREGSRTTHHRVGGRFTAGQEHVLDLGVPKLVTGLRISDDNRGRYKVWVRPAPARRSHAPAPVPVRRHYAQPRHATPHAAAPRAAGGHGGSPPPPSACGCGTNRPCPNANQRQTRAPGHAQPPPPPPWHTGWGWDPWSGRRY